MEETPDGALLDLRFADQRTLVMKGLTTLSRLPIIVWKLHVHLLNIHS